MTPRQARFVEEYLIDLNATQAAVRAGYSPKSANSHGPRLLRRPKVKAALDRAMKARSERTRVTAGRILEELACLAFADLRDVADWGPEGVVARPAGALSREAARAVAEVSDSGSGASRRVKVKLHDKKAALDALAKHLGLYLNREEFAATVKDVLPPLKVILSGISSPSQTE